MSTQRSGEARAAQTDEALSDPHVSDQSLEHVDRWPLDKPIPVTVRDADLMGIVGLAKSKFYARKRRGDFRFLELEKQLPDSNTLYSGHLVTLWTRSALRLPGDSRRFFGRAPSARTGRPRQASVSHGSPSPDRAPQAAEERAPGTSESAGEVREFPVRSGQ